MEAPVPDNAITGGHSVQTQPVQMQPVPDGFMVPPPPVPMLPPIPQAAIHVQQGNFIAYNSGFNDGYLRGYYVAMNSPSAGGRGGGYRGYRGRGGGYRGRGGPSRGRGRGNGFTTDAGQQVVFTAQATNTPGNQ